MPQYTDAAQVAVGFAKVLVGCHVMLFTMVAFGYICRLLLNLEYGLVMWSVHHLVFSGSVLLVFIFMATTLNLSGLVEEL